MEVAAVQHVYTATQSNLAAYTIPRWASNGGREEMLEPLRDSETVRRLNVETLEMLAFTRGCASSCSTRGSLPCRSPSAA